MRCRGRRSNMDSGRTGQPSPHAADREKRNHRSRYGTACHGIPEASASFSSGQCRRSRRCSHRTVTGSEMHCRRQTGSRYNRPDAYNQIKFKRQILKVYLYYVWNSLYFQHSPTNTGVETKGLVDGQKDTPPRVPTGVAFIVVKQRYWHTSVCR